MSLPDLMLWMPKLCIRKASDEVQIYPETLSWQWKAVSKESTGIFSFSKMLWFQAPPVLQRKSSEIQLVHVAWKASELSSSKARCFEGFALLGYIWKLQKWKRWCFLAAFVIVQLAPKHFSWSCSLVCTCRCIPASRDPLTRSIL